MTDDKISILLDSIQNLLTPTEAAALSKGSMAANEPEKRGIKLGLFNGMNYIAEGHDFDECNDEIAELFGVEEE